MASVGMQLISHIIRTGKLDTVLEWGITHEDFLGAEERAMFDVLLGYRSQTGAILGPNLLAHKFPTFTLCDDGPQVTTEALCQEVRYHRLSKDSRAVAEELAKGAESSVVDALSTAQAKISRMLQLTTSKKLDLSYYDAYHELVDDYQKMERGEWHPKAYFPWKVLNDATMGYQEDDYIVLYGRPKSMKSWVLCYLIAHAYDTGRRVLVYTKEMTPKNIYKRVSACAIELPYAELRTAKLTGEYKDAFFHYQHRIQEMKDDPTRFMCLSGKDVSNGGDTVSWLRAKIERYKPDLVFVDGLYLMSPEGLRKNAAMHERVENISRSIRQLILETRTPLAATMQANRKAAQNTEANLDEVAFSDAVSQDATMLVRVINEHKTSPTIAMVLGGTREFTLNGFRIGGVPSTDFSFKEVLDAKTIAKAKELDTDEESGASKPKTLRYNKKEDPEKAKTAQKENKELERHIKQAIV